MNQSLVAKWYSTQPVELRRREFDPPRGNQSVGREFDPPWER